MKAVETSAPAGGLGLAVTSSGDAPPAGTTRQASRAELTMYRLSQWLRSPRPYLMLLGFALFLGFWYLAVEVWKLPRFSRDAGPDDRGDRVAQPGSDLRPLDLYRRVLRAHLGQRPPGHASPSSWPRQRAFRSASSSAGRRRSRNTSFRSSSCCGRSRRSPGSRSRSSCSSGSETPVIFLTFLASFYRDRAQHHARRRIDRRILRPRRLLPRRQALAGVPAT